MADDDSSSSCDQPMEKVRDANHDAIHAAGSDDGNFMNKVRAINLDEVQERAMQFFHKTAEHAVSIKWEDLPEKAKKFVEENPALAGLLVVNGIVIIAPALLTGPLLGLLGFTAVGPAAGSIAAGWQAGITPVAAGGLFATLQSAAMGGYGAAVVGGIAQGVAVISSIATTGMAMNQTEAEGGSETQT